MQFWPVVGWVNHQYIPQQFRVIFHSLIAVGWYSLHLQPTHRLIYFTRFCGKWNRPYLFLHFQGNISESPSKVHGVDQRLTSENIRNHDMSSLMICHHWWIMLPIARIYYVVSTLFSATINSATLVLIYMRVTCDECWLKFLLEMFSIALRVFTLLVFYFLSLFSNNLCMSLHACVYCVYIMMRFKGLLFSKGIDHANETWPGHDLI